MPPTKLSGLMDTSPKLLPIWMHLVLGVLESLPGKTLKLTASLVRPENGWLEYDCFLLFPLQPIFRGELFVLWSVPFNKTSLNSCVLPGISVLVLGRFSAVEELWLRVWLKGRGLNSS